MSSDNEFKGLWNKLETPSAPDAGVILKKAAQLKRRMWIKLTGQTLLLTATMVFIILIVLFFRPQMLTTKIGALLITGAIVSFVIPSVRIIRDIFRGDPESSNTEFLSQFIRLKQKQESLQTTLLTIYFILFSAGIFLYMIEYARMMSLAGRLSAYGITMAWVAFNWFWIRPRTIKKQRDALNAMISKLEKVNDQLA